jgi:hypothetical protein
MNFSWNAFVTLFCFGTLMVILQGIFAYNDNFFTVTQMRAKGFEKGVPLLYHLGIWGDFLILTPLMSYIVAKYGDQWQTKEIYSSGIIGIVSIIVLGFIWAKSAQHGLPESHTYGGKITAAGFVHAVYFVVVLAVIILTFFYTAISQEAAIIIAVILGLHVVYGTHMVLGLIGPSWYSDRPHENPLTWAIILVSWGLLLWRCLKIH